MAPTAARAISAVALIGCPAMSQAILAASPAFVKTFGLVVVFGGIGLLVNIIILYIAFQIRGERQQNRADLTAPDRTRSV